MVVSVFQPFMALSQKTQGETREDAQENGIILSMARVDSGQTPVTQLLTDNGIHGKHHQELYDDHHCKNLLEAIIQLLDTVK